MYYLAYLDDPQDLDSIIILEFHTRELMLKKAVYFQIVGIEILGVWFEEKKS